MAPTIFEYLVHCFYPDGPRGESEVLRKFGEEGWELVSVITDGRYRRFYFKRGVA
jgi:hypothetical protein